MSKLVRRASLGLAIVLAMTSLSACDSDNPGQGLGGGTFLVRYELEGSCSGFVAVGYTIGVGATAGDAPVLPWSSEHSIDTSGATTPVAVALSASCAESGGVTNTLHSRLYVNGDLKDSANSSSSSTFSVSISAILQ